MPTGTGDVQDQKQRFKKFLQYIRYYSSPSLYYFDQQRMKDIIRTYCYRASEVAEDNRMREFLEKQCKKLDSASYLTASTQSIVENLQAQVTYYKTKFKRLKDENKILKQRLSTMADDWEQIMKKHFQDYMKTFGDLSQQQQSDEQATKTTLQSFLKSQPKISFDHGETRSAGRKNSSRKYSSSFEQNDINRKLLFSPAKVGSPRQVEKNQNILGEVLERIQKTTTAEMEIINQTLNDNPNIHTILITGGPCAGKTSAMTALEQDLTQSGYKVLIVPEAATIIRQGGAMIVSSNFTQKQGLIFQKALLRLQVALETVFYQIALLDFEAQHNKVCILVDRGLLDGSAYVEEKAWNTLMKDLGVTTSDMRDRRYQVIIHMQTAADGAEAFYDATTNSARYEDINEARTKDRSLISVYQDHPQFVPILNSKCRSFKDKLDEVKKFVYEVLNAKQNYQI